MNVFVNNTVSVDNGVTQTFTYNKTLNPTQRDLAQNQEGYTLCHFRISHNEALQDLCFAQPFAGKFNHSTVFYKRVVADNLVEYLNFSVRVYVYTDRQIRVDVNGTFFDGRNVASKVNYTFCFDYIEFFY